MNMETIGTLIEQETRRQRETLSLIPSENIASPRVLSALGTALVNKYAEGKSHQRYYFGNAVVDEIEDQVKRLVLEAFGLSGTEWAVNVQPYSGSVANMAAYLGLLNLKDTVLAMSLDHGGHLTHGHSVSWTGKLFAFRHYGVEKSGYLDYEVIRAMAKEVRPRMIVCGATAYSRTIDFAAFREVADEVGAYLLADISHIAGLIAGGVHPPPFPHADVVMSTTHKTLRGPRGAFLVMRKDLSDAIDKAVFPGLQGGPHLHTISAIGVALEEVLQDSFSAYAKQVVANAQKLSQELESRGCHIISGGTDNHLMLVDLRPLGIGGREAGEKLERAGIVVNKNMIPYDTGTPQNPSGIRLGTPSVTTRGMREPEMEKIARLIHEIVTRAREPEEAKKEVLELAREFSAPGLSI